MLRRHVWLPHRVGAERQHLAIFDPMEKNVALLNEFKPDVIDANGSYLPVLFGYLHRTGVPCHLPKAVFYSSEGASEAIRRLIMDEFHLPLLSAYQTTEAFKLGFECDQHTGYHLNLDLYPLRLVDPEGRTVPNVDRDQTRRRLTAGFATACGEDVAVDISFVEPLPRTPAGKIRAMVPMERNLEL